MLAHHVVHSAALANNADSRPVESVNHAQTNQHKEELSSSNFCIYWRSRFHELLNQSFEIYFIVIGVVWLVAGTTFYHLQLHLAVPKAFYMAINVGYSIGWGDIKEDQMSKLFSIFQVLIGSSFVAAALGFFAQNVVENRNNWYTAELSHEAYKAKMVRLEEQHNYVMLTISWLTFNSVKLLPVFLWIIFILGASFSAYFLLEGEGVTVIDAVYFALSSLSTGGLQALPENSPDWMYGMTGVYVAVGVPVMAVAIATLAGFLITFGDIKTTMTKIRSPVSKVEIDMLTKFGKFYVPHVASSNVMCGCDALFRLIYCFVLQFTDRFG